MPLQENTVEGWSGVITELTTKRQSLLQNLESYYAGRNTSWPWRLPWETKMPESRASA